MKYTGDANLPEMTDAVLEEALTTIVPYTIVVLKPGPKYDPPGPTRNPWVAKIVWQHGKRNFALRAAGLMPIILPVGDGGEIKGISIFDASREEAEWIMSEDPAVKEGIFIYELHPTRTFPGSALPAPS